MPNSDLWDRFLDPFLTHMSYSYNLTQVILHRAYVLLLNIGCIGRHVILSLSDVTKRQNDVSFIQDGGLKCRVLKGKMDLI